MWRNRTEFPVGQQQVNGFLQRKWAAGGVYLSALTAQAMAAALGGKAGRSDPWAGGLGALSPREHQVFSLLILGQTVSEIGAALTLAPNTVSTYRARILEKTGVRNDVELTLYAQRHIRTPSGRPLRVEGGVL